MASAVLTNKRLVLKYEKGSFTFNKIDMLAGNEGLYSLAGHINAVQDEKPPKQILVVSTKQII